MALQITVNRTLRNTQLAVPALVKLLGLAVIDHARVVLKTAGNGIPAEAEPFGNLRDTEVRFADRGWYGHDSFLLGS